MTPNPLLEGAPLRSLYKLALPIVFANVLQSAYQLTDTFWVGRLGGHAVAAVSVSFPLIFLMISVGAGFTIAGSTLVAQYTGAKNLQMVNQVTGQTLLLMGAAAALLSVLGYFGSGPILGLMGVESAIHADATAYLQVSFLGLIFMYGYFMYQSIMRGLGEVKVPLYIVLFTVVLNLALDPLFIFGAGPIPALGVRGAAYATIGTQSIAMFLGFTALFGGRFGISLTRAQLAPNPALLGQILRLGLPASLDQSTRALGMSMMTFLVASFGTLTVAVFGIGSRIYGFVIIPALGLSMATSTLVGQNIGAGQLARAKMISRLSARVAFFTLCGVGLCTYCFAEPLVAFFVPDSPRVIQEGAVMVRIVSFAFPFVGVQQAMIGTFRGSGNTFLSMMLSMVSMWMLQFPLAYLLSKHTNLAEVGLWYTYPLANAAASMISLSCFFHGGWTRKILIEPTEAKVAERIFEQEGLR